MDKMSAMAGHTRGTGSVYLRGSVYWISYWVNGRQIKESAKTSDEAEARRQLKIKVGAAAAGNAPAPARTTIADLCALVLEDNRIRKLRDAKHVEWRYWANVERILGNILASRFGNTQIQQYIKQRRGESASEATINREFSIIRRGFQLGYEADPPLVTRIPAIHKLEEDNARQGFIEQEEYERLIDELPEKLKAIFVCGYHTGARKNELRRIRWAQVDFSASLIRLEGRQTKNKRPRTLPIYGDMERWLERQKDTAPKGSPWVFHGKRKYPVDNHLLGWTEACERAGLAGLLFHDLRRSAVRNMKRAGVQDAEAMRVSGHKTRAVFDRYNIVDEAALGKIGEQMEKFIETEKMKRAAKLRRA